MSIGVDIGVGVGVGVGNDGGGSGGGVVRITSVVGYFIWWAISFVCIDGGCTWNEQSLRLAGLPTLAKMSWPRWLRFSWMPA